MANNSNDNSSDFTSFDGNETDHSEVNAIVLQALESGAKVHIDSRKISPGDLFVALPGDNTDGNLYVRQAIDAGAAVILADINRCKANESAYAEEKETALLLVTDPLATLQQCAHQRRLKSKAKVIAITGSAGKTSVKEITHKILSQFGKCHANVGNFNNHIGLPITLAELPSDADFAVLEAGMNHAGELDLLTRIARPDIVVITTVLAAHSANFDSVKDIALAKAELLRGIKPEGTAIIGCAHEFADVLLSEAARLNISDIRTVNTHKGDYFAYLEEYTPGNPLSTIRYQLADHAGTFKSKLRGIHQAYCVLLGLAAAQATGIDLKQAEAVTPSFQSLPGRGIETTFTLPDSPAIKRTLIDESYNSSPAAVMATLESAAMHHKSDSICAVIGDMLELGGNIPGYYQEIADFAEKHQFCGVVTVGADSQTCSDQLKGTLSYVRHYTTSSEAAAALPSELPEQATTIVVKGSRGIRLERVVEACTEARDI